MELSTTSGSGGTSCTLLDKAMGFRCLASLLGVGTARLDKKASATPDLRFGKRQHRSQPGSWTVDGFLQVAYDAIAETLPDEFLVSKQQTNILMQYRIIKNQSKGPEVSYYCSKCTLSRHMHI